MQGSEKRMKRAAREWERTKEDDAFRECSLGARTSSRAIISDLSKKRAQFQPGEKGKELFSGYRNAGMNQDRTFRKRRRLRPSTPHLFFFPCISWNHACDKYTTIRSQIKFQGFKLKFCSPTNYDCVFSVMGFACLVMPRMRNCERNLVFLEIHWILISSSIVKIFNAARAWTEVSRT